MFCFRKNTYLTLFFSFLIFLSFLISCKKDEYRGYKNIGNNIHYKLLSIGENDTKPKPGDYITVDLTYKTIQDSVFFKGRRKFKITEPETKGTIDECFLKLSEKDQASFIISSDIFFNHTLQTHLPGFLTQGDMMKVDIKLLGIQTEQEYLNEKEAFLHWIEDFGDYERVLLKQYLDKSELNIQPTKTGLYKIQRVPGNGVGVVAGDTVIVHYEGKFLNGKFFDSTKKRKEAFRFIYGQKWQVIKGLEEAIGLMEEGEKSVFILPSDLAFGEKGSSTGIIPPFTSLIFEVELVSIKKK